MRNALMLLVCLALPSTTLYGENWPGWRGPRADGVSGEPAIATEWDGPSGRNILWKQPLTDVGHASPIVWEHRILLTGCQESTGERALSCFDRDSGKLLWRRVVLTAPLEKKHHLNSYASGTPATDGERIYATFLAPDFGSLSERTPGDMVVTAFDMDGKPLWEKRPGRFASIHGYCSSPVLFEDLVIINGDHDGDAYIVALKRDTGEEVWKVDRPNKTRSYVTPLIRELAGHTQMILSGSKSVTSYDPRTGELLWYMDGPTEQFVASVVDDGELIYVTAGFPERHILAIRPDGSGHISDNHIVWRTTRNCSYVPSPIIVGPYYLVAADNGVATCFRAQSGEPLWTERLGRQFSASLVANAGRVYFLSDDGETIVVEPGESLKVIAENKLGEHCYASPAISQGTLFVRGTQHLWAIR